MREVTIGRSRNSDIFLDANCVYASHDHAVIYFDGHSLMYRDTSTNGTLINNINVKQRAVPIRPGDSIMIASHYPLSWEQILPFFPQLNTFASSPYADRRYDGRWIAQDCNAKPDNLNKWSWGAFAIYPIWGLFNGCWWTLLIGVFLSWFWPIPNIIMGIYGRRWAWENKTWENIEVFENSQKNWNTAGIIIFCLNLVTLPFLFLLLLAAS